MAEVHALDLLMEIVRVAEKNYPVLAGIGDGLIPDPNRSIVLLARNDQKRPIGRLMLVAPAHVEGIWIAPEYRGKSLFKDLMNAMEIEARAEGISKLFAYAISEEIGHYIKRRCNYSQLHWKVYAKELSCR